MRHAILTVWMVHAVGVICDLANFCRYILWLWHVVLSCFLALTGKGLYFDRMVYSGIDTRYQGYGGVMVWSILGNLHLWAKDRWL